MKRHYIFIFILTILFANGNTQVPAEPITIGEKIVHTSEMYKEDRTLSVFLPKSYYKSDKDYPVVYRLDGEFTFIQTLGDVSRLVYFDEYAPEMIVVCIHNNNRDRDMLPSISKYSPDGGSNEKFLLYLKEELIPYINSKYRTSDFRILCGQSFSGLFTVFNFLKAPELFKGYIAISPSTADCKTLLLEMADGTTMTEERRKTLLHISRGGDGREIDIGLSAMHILDIVLGKGKDREDKFLWHFDVYENEGHVPRSALYDGLKWIFENSTQ